MAYYALVFALVAVTAAALGMSGLAGAAAHVAYAVGVIFAGLALIAWLRRAA